MTTWTDQSTISTNWSSKTYNPDTSVLYNSPVPYSADYITYNGYYVKGETDWSGASVIQTAWRS